MPQFDFDAVQHVPFFRTPSGCQQNVARGGRRYAVINDIFRCALDQVGCHTDVFFPGQRQIFALPPLMRQQRVFHYVQWMQLEPVHADVQHQVQRGMAMFFGFSGQADDQMGA